MPLNSYLRNLLGKTSSKVKKVVADRIQAQKNFNKRKDNSNYYGSLEDYLKK